MRGVPRLCLALLGLAAAPVAVPAAGDAAGPEVGDDLLEFLEFLGDEATAGDAWSGFLDSLPEPADEPLPPAGEPAEAAGARQ